MALNPNAYIDQKLEEFRRQLVGQGPGSVVENQSIFSPAIEQYQIPAGVKLPKVPNRYLGITSPSEHLDNYAVHMSLNPDHDALKCKLFGITLGEHARTWYINLPKGSIRSFAELKEKFLAQFASAKPVKRPTEILHKIVQGPNESLRSYMTRFSRAALTVADFVDQTGQSAFVQNIHPSKQYKYLLGHQHTPTFSALMEAAAAHAATEEKMSLFPEMEVKAGPDRRPAKGDSYQQERRGDLQSRSYRSADRRRTDREEVRTLPRQHQTNYVGNDEDDMEFPVVYAIFGGGKPGYIPSKRKAYEAGRYRSSEVMQVNLEEAAKSYPNNDLVPITFTEDEAKRLSQPHGDALVVELEIAKHKVMRNLIDGGSSADILFTRAFSQLKLPDNTLKPVKNPLWGFSGNEVMPLGQIKLKVVFGTAPCQSSVGVNFLVVDSPSVYNTIIGRETLHALRAVASTYHMLLKFPTPNGIGVVDGAQMVSREMYELATTARSQRLEHVSTKRHNPGECLQVGIVDYVDYGVITGAIQFGSLDPRDDF
ncbi:hypothetical protein UlMin_037741 [Ulmus minor]